MVRRLVRLLLIPLLLYAVLCAIVFFQQRSLLFPAPTELAPANGLERVTIPHGTFALTRLMPGDGPVVVHFHGNAEQVAHLSWLGQAWAEQACSFVAVEYPGYPGADGSPSEESLTVAADAALTHLTTTMGIARSRIVLSGQSVGTGVAVAMAAKGWGAKLVLLSPYTSLPDVGARVFTWLPVRLLMRDRFDSKSRAASVKIPTLIIHGTQDEVIPFDLGAELATTFPDVKFVPREGRHHNDLWDDEGVQSAVFSFVAEP